MVADAKAQALATPQRRPSFLKRRSDGEDVPSAGELGWELYGIVGLVGLVVDHVGLTNGLICLPWFYDFNST